MNNIFKLKFLIIGLLVVNIFFIYDPVKNAHARDKNCTITSNLILGSKGEQVRCLQKTIGVTNTGYYGKKTKSAVKEWQSSEGLDSDGIIGSSSRKILNIKNVAKKNIDSPTCSTGKMDNEKTSIVCTPSVTLPSLSESRSEGTISRVILKGSPSNIQVAEGITNTQVLGFQISADSGSNLSIENVKFSFVLTGSGSTWPTRYISKISVWQGGIKVGSIDASLLSQNGTSYSASIPLVESVVTKNSTVDFFISIDTNTAIDSSDANNIGTIFLDTIRYKDGSGVVLTTTPLGIRQPVRFLKLSNNPSVKLILSEDSTNPRNRIVTTNYTSSTNDVSLLKFNLTAQGSDLYIGGISLPATATGVMDAHQISSYYKLKYNGRVISSFTDSQTGLNPYITFGDTTVAGSTLLDGAAASIYIPLGATANLEVVADINPLCNVTSSTNPCTGVMGTQFDAGDTLKVDFPPSVLMDPVATYVEDQVGNQLSGSSVNRQGSASGYDATFRVQGLSATLAASPAVTNTYNNSGVLTTSTVPMDVSVTASGSDFFIPRSVGIATSASDTTIGANGFLIAPLNNAYAYSTPTTSTGISATVSIVSGATTDGSGRFKVNAGQTAVFRITATVTNGSTPVAGSRYVQLNAVGGAIDTTTAPTSFATTPAASFQSAGTAAF